MDELKEQTGEVKLPVVTMPTNNINQGAVVIESNRAIAEAQAKMIIAKKFPRDEVEAYSRAMLACQRRGLAEKAFYSYPKAGKAVSGASIRFAEELARCWGNMDFGIKELSQDEGKSEMQAYAWDYETNVNSIQSFVVHHIRDKKDGVAEKLTQQRDIYELTANMGARRLRARILSILPIDYVEMAIAECKKTLAGKNDEPLIDRIKNMVVAFQKIGVSKEMLIKRLQKPVENMTTDDLVEYTGIYNALKDGVQKVQDWFDGQKTAGELSDDIKNATEKK